MCKPSLFQMPLCSKFMDHSQNTASSDRVALFFPGPIVSLEKEEYRRKYLEEVMTNYMLQSAGLFGKRKILCFLHKLRSI